MIPFWYLEATKLGTHKIVDFQVLKFFKEVKSN